MVHYGRPGQKHAKKCGNSVFNSCGPGADFILIFKKEIYHGDSFNYRCSHRPFIAGGSEHSLIVLLLHF